MHQPRPTARRSRALPLALLLVSLLACKAGGGLQGTGPMEAGAEHGAPTSADPAFQLKSLRTKLQLAELGAQREIASAEQELRAAEHGLQMAQAELSGFLDGELKLRLAEATLDLEKSQNRLEEARAELSELESMYAAEEFATMTKELVLERGRRALDVAGKELAGKQQRFENLEKRELPREQLAKEWAVAEARVALDQAQSKLRFVEAEQGLEVETARQAVVEAEANKKQSDKSKGSDSPGGQG